MSYLTSKAMQTTAIGTVANSLPENKVILITLLNSSRYIPYTDLRKNSRIALQNKERLNNNPIEKHSHIVPYAPVTSNLTARIIFRPVSS